MAIAVKVKGLDEYIAALTIAPAEIHKEIRIQFKEELEAIDLEAQHNHNYHTQSGILGRAIDYEVSSDGLTGIIWLDRDSKGAPYSWYIHEGYIGLTMNRKSGQTKPFSGPAPDQFLYEAADRRTDLLIDAMSIAIGRALNQVGL